jgi:C-terminal processing protease CtpA/Prc
MLRANAAAGRYDRGTRGELAKRVTDDMLAVHKDGHLHVELLNANGAGGARVGGKPLPPLIQSAKWIAPGIAYIRPSAFKSTPEEIVAFKAFMEGHKDAKTIIFDLRNHHGGRLGEMDVIFPYLFATKTPLVKMEMARSLYDENGSPFGDSSTTLSVEKGPQMVTTTHYAIPGPVTPLRQAKVYLLVSNASASAAEHFSLAMKSTGRGTLIGEATAGANHFGGGMDLNDHFGVWMPFGRTYDIKTGKDWEGSGIAPDIAVDPRLALVKALELSGVSPDEAAKLDAQEIPAEPVHKDRLAAR